MIRWRPATREDVPAVVALLRDDMLGQAREDEDMAPYLAAFEEMGTGNQVIVGEEAGRILATYQLTIIPGLSRRATRRAQVEAVRVATDLRGRGIGALLMADAEARARAGGCGLIQLTTSHDRHRAHAFYARQGYAASHLGFKKPL